MAEIIARTVKPFFKPEFSEIEYVIWEGVDSEGHTVYDFSCILYNRSNPRPPHREPSTLIYRTKSSTLKAIAEDYQYKRSES